MTIPISFISYLQVSDDPVTSSLAGRLQAPGQPPVSSS
jgi:hypothetical protein